MLSVELGSSRQEQVAVQVSLEASDKHQARKILLGLRGMSHLLSDTPTDRIPKT